MKSSWSGCTDQLSSTSTQNPADLPDPSKHPSKKAIITESNIHVVSPHCAFVSVPIIVIFVIIKDDFSQLYSVKLEYGTDILGQAS